MLEMNKSIVYRIVKAVESGTLGDLDELIDPEFVGHIPLVAEDIHGLDGLKGFFGAIQAAMPDIRHLEVTLVAEGDLVVLHGQNEGTFTYAYMGLPPTGNKVSYWMANIWQIANGKAVECWFNLDTLGLMQQLGAVPVMA